MKRLMIIIGVISMIFVIEACSSKSKNQITPPAPAPAEPAKSEPEVPVVPPWKIVLNSTCPDTSRDECVAGHGFTIVGDGKFLIGPAPQGQTLSGLLEPAEFKSIEEIATRLLLPMPSEANVGPSSNCMPHTEGESDDKVVFINNHGKEIEVLHTAGMDLCFRAPTLEDAETIHKLISDLAKKYYALPFPDVCADSAIALKALYPPTTAPS